MTQCARFSLFPLLASLIMATAAAQEAYVYIDSAAGAVAYNASSTGKLSVMPGSPFKTAGPMVGTNGKFYVTLHAGSLYAYAVESNGAIGKEVSSIQLSPYSGGDCYAPGTPLPAELDHTGHYVYISLQNSRCEALQTFSIGSTGFLTFTGASFIIYGSGQSVPLPTLTGNDMIGLSVQTDPGPCSNTVAEFDRERGGTLNFLGGVRTSPVPQEPGWYYLPLGPITDDPSDHVAVAVAQVQAPAYECGPTGPPQLASYTVRPGGEPGFFTSNTWQNMPTVPGGVTSMRLDPAGKFLAVATGTGVQFFHFNGASPITPFSGVIGVSGSIVQMEWDRDGHLYALNTSGKMHVYAVTSKSVVETSRSRTVVPIGHFTVRTK